MITPLKVELPEGAESQKIQKLTYNKCRPEAKQPFRLELPERYNRRFHRTQRLLYTKGEYRPEVKVPGWEIHSDSLPYDQDPYDPSKMNYFLSHYKTFGQNTKTSYETTTKSALEQIYNKELRHKMVINPKMLNFYSYSDDCIESKPVRPPTDVCVDFSTTMQSSYPMPYPFKMQRLGIPKIPYLLYQKLKRVEPEMSTEKFYDENFAELTGNIQKVKKGQWSTVNPITGENHKYIDFCT